MTTQSTIETRTIDVDLREVRSEGNTLRGHAAVFGVLSEDLGGFRERIAPGAFNDVLAAGADVRLLVDHAPPPLARTKAGTLRLYEDQTGLAFEADLPDNAACVVARDGGSGTPCARFAPRFRPGHFGVCPFAGRLGSLLRGPPHGFGRAADLLHTLASRPL